MSSTKIDLTENRTLREAHYARTEVLDHFDWFKMTDGRDRLTADEVAAMYEVTPDALKHSVADNLDELSSNGYSKMSAQQARGLQVPLKTTYNYPQGA